MSKTPLERLIENKQITKKKEKELLKVVHSVNPFELQKTVEVKIKKLQIMHRKKIDKNIRATSFEQSFLLLKNLFIIASSLIINLV